MFKVLSTDLMVGEPWLSGRIVVHIALPCLHARLHEGLAQGRPERRVGYCHVSAVVVILVILHDARDLDVLRLLEVRQHVLEAPALVAHGCPVVIVSVVASGEDHVVQHTTSTHHFAPRYLTSLLVHGCRQTIVQ